VAPVFVPSIGFRLSGTRTLRERVETTADETNIAVLALAAAPAGTDVVIEWNRRGGPAICEPGSRLLEHSHKTPLANGLAAEIVVAANKLTAVTASRRSLHMSYESIGAIDAITFPPLPPLLNEAELDLREGGKRWRVPFSVAPAAVKALPLTAEASDGGVVVRATAFCR